MGLNEIKLGLPVPYLPDCLLRQLVGVRTARDMMETGEFYPAEELLKMGEHALEAAALLASASVDLLCYGCTVETILEGIEYDKKLTEDLQKTTGIPAKTMAGAVVDALPGQGGKVRPLAEFSRHRTPIQGLYATGSAWGLFHTGSSAQGYACYKAIAEDMGLGKPWEEKRRSY